MSFKSAIKNLLSAIAKFTYSIGLLPSRIILQADGGICSQMHFYLVGTYLKNICRCDIRYDLDWFYKYGTDLNNQHPRNFDLLKLFPNLNFREEKKGIIKKIYAKLFYKVSLYSYNYNESEIKDQFSPPSFISGYFNLNPLTFKSLFLEYFHFDAANLPQDNLSILESISKFAKTGETCGVHIRRGDLSVYHEVYGSPCAPEYFIDSISYVHNYIQKHFENRPIKFFIFSDDPEWFRSEIQEKIYQYDFQIIDLNGSDRGWCDLGLMAECKHLITSQGSMGKYAALLRKNDNNEGLVILPNNSSAEEWKELFRHAVIRE